MCVTEVRVTSAWRKKKSCYTQLSIIGHVRVDNAFIYAINLDRFTFAVRPTPNRRPSSEIRERNRHVANRNGKEKKKDRSFVTLRAIESVGHRSRFLSYNRLRIKRRRGSMNCMYADATPTRFFPERSSMYPALPSL